MKDARTLAVVTGASSGIGAAFARALAAEGTPLVLVARNTAALETLARELRALRGGAAEVLAADLGTPAGLDAVWDATEGAGRPVALFVNNAGFGLNGAETDLSLDRVHALLELNVVATTKLTHRFLVAMKARRAGAILNVASTSAFYPTPYFSLYGASKAFILNFTHALHEEARTFGVTVTCVCPGFTKTNFAAVAGMKSAEATPFPEMSPEAVAKIGLEAVGERRAVVVTHPLDRVWIFLGRFVPRSVPAKLGARFFSKTRLGG
jgi:short-subunit dehydrogenase